MLTHLIDFTPDQLATTAVALGIRVRWLLDSIRRAMDADYLTAAQVRERVLIDLRLLRPALAALSKMSPAVADEHLSEMGALMTEYHEVMVRRFADEAAVDAWNARVEADKMAATESRSVTAGA